MNSRSAGAKLYKADFHTHTPGSKDYDEKNASAQQIVESAKRAGIDILAVTDHNSAEWVDKVRKASKGTSLTIIPGVEITTPEGHILALFERHYDFSKITDFLIEIGIPREEHGKEEAISSSHAEEVIRKIRAASGVAIAAHANSTNGLLKSKGQYKLKMVPMPELAALELAKQGEIERFCEGNVSKDYPPKSCTQSSDSHKLSEIGRRFTYLRMHEPSLKGIRQALLDYEVKVRFSWNYQEAIHPRILSLTVDQGFFGGQHFEFHENLNCLVGGKGTGKSTVIEFLRYCFGDVSDFEYIRKDHEGKIATLVGDGGAVTVTYLDSDGEIKTVTREVQPWETDREVREASGNTTSVETPPAFFSQGELVQIAASPIAQLELIDRRLDLTEDHHRENEIVRQLKANANSLVGGSIKIDKLQEEIDHPEKGKEPTEKQYRRLETQLKVEVLKEFPKWEAEQHYLDNLDAALETFGRELGDALEEVDVEAVRIDPPKDAPNLKMLKPIQRIAEGVEALLNKLQGEALTEIAQSRQAITGAKKKLAPLFKAKKGQHDKVLKGLGEESVRKANAQFRSLGKRLETLRRYGDDLSKLKERQKKLERTRKRLREQLRDVREERLKKRVVKAEEYEQALDGMVRIKLIGGGDRQAFAKGIRELSKRGYIKEPDIKKLAELEPSALIQYAEEGAVAKIAKQSGVTNDVARRLVESFASKSRENLYGLECVPLPDRPEITYRVASGKEKKIHELSTGQKGTVIIALAMVEDRGPLVIDHPEEPLDTQSIYGQVVKTLRKSKEGRQFVFATHNANIAVGADAELSHILDATADKGRIKSSGAIDHDATNKLLLVHLEGGEEALNLRVQKYRQE